MNLYQTFRSSSLDIAPLGLVTGADESTLSCTPADARIVAWLTQDPRVHFCQVDGLGDTVFVVDPSAAPGDWIHPVAGCMAQFIGLLRQCPDASLIAFAYRWSGLYFHKKMSAISLTDKAQSILRALENIYHPPVLQDPYEVMEAVRNDFDYASIPLQPHYFDTFPIRPGIPKWEVGFETDFAESCPKGQGSKELAVNRSFQWREDSWCVPAVYLSESGIIIDTYLSASADEISAFTERWNSATLSMADKIDRQLEDPLTLDACGTLYVNDKEFRPRKVFNSVWNPLTDNDWQTRQILEHYRLDRSRGYLFRRECYLRKGKYPPIRTMQLSLHAEPVWVAGDCFTASDAPLILTNPDTGLKHTLTVVSQTEEALNPNFLSNHPCCYSLLVYKLEPALNSDSFRILDRDPGDEWEGNQDDPADVVYKGKKKPTGSYALSSLRNTHPAQIRWCAAFRQRRHQDIRVRLLP